MDLDARALVFFGGEDEMGNAGLQAAVLRLVRSSWEDWQVAWAHDGVADIAAMLGIEPGVVLVDEVPEWVSDGPRESVEHYFGGAGRPDESCMVITVRTSDGIRDSRIYRSPDGIEEILAHGPALLASSRQATSELAREIQVESGAFVDVRERRLAYWFSHPARDHQLHLARRWPDYHVERHVGGYAEHLRRSGRPSASLLLRRSELLPHAPRPTCDLETDLVALRAERRAEGSEIQLHPRVEESLRDLDALARRREEILQRWLAGFPG